MHTPCTALVIKNVLTAKINTALRPLLTKYDGVCIAFRQERLEEVLHGTEGIKCDKTNIMPILYGDAKIKSVLNEWMKEALHKSIELSKDPDQSQDIIPPIPITRNKANNGVSSES